MPGFPCARLTIRTALTRTADRGPGHSLSVPDSLGGLQQPVSAEHPGRRHTRVLQEHPLQGPRAQPYPGAQVGQLPQRPVGLGQSTQLGHLPGTAHPTGIRCGEDVFESSSKHGNPRRWVAHRSDPLEQHLFVDARGLPEGHGAVGERRGRSGEEGPQTAGRGHRRDGPSSSAQDAGRQLSGHPVQSSLNVPGWMIGATGVGVADGEVRSGVGQHLLAVHGVVREVPLDSPEAIDQSGQRGRGRVPGQTDPLPQQPRVKDPAAVLLDRFRPRARHACQAIHPADADLQAVAFAGS